MNSRGAVAGLRNRLRRLLSGPPVADPGPAEGGGPTAGRSPGSTTVDLLAAPGLTTSGYRADPVVSDPERQRELAEFGFTVLPGLDPVTLALARRIDAEIGPARDDPQRALNWSFHSHEVDHKRRVSDALRDGVWPTIRSQFDRQAPFLSTFITKWPGPDSGFAPHRDPTLVDERTAIGVTVWIPLLDVDQSNGMLWIVPGSHRFPGGFRVSDVDQFPFVDCEDDILEEHGTGIPLAAGEILVFDNRVVHHSLPNVTATPRVVVSFGLRPADGPSTLSRRRGDVVEVHALPEDFYIDVEPSDQHQWHPDGPPLFTAALDGRRWSPEEFASLCRAVPLPPRAVRPAPDRPRWTDPAAFCSLCGTDLVISTADRHERNNAQLICAACRGS